MPSHETKLAASRARAQDQIAALSDEEDKAVTDAALADPDAQPLDEKFLSRMRPISESDAADLTRRVRGRPPLDAPKRLVSIRLDLEVIERFRATGPGWQSRINELLRKHLPGVSK